MKKSLTCIYDTFRFVFFIISVGALKKTKSSLEKNELENLSLSKVTPQNTPVKETPTKDEAALVKVQKISYTIRGL